MRPHDWRPIRKLTAVEAEKVRGGECWFNGKRCWLPLLCSLERTRCRRELEADLDSGYYGEEQRGRR